ncbi:MAG: GNAT family N-acetyltransferase [Alphaproteobacteria bacterium]|nr:GNAT family N-acetyltransferase [Alphaproteobacteria bacterium]
MARGTAPCRVEPLDERHDRSRFGCGVEPLDRFFRRQAGQDMRRRVSTCFIAVADGDPSIAGFYTLSASEILLASLPPDLAKRLPRYPNVPAVLMGRLAVDLRHRGKGIGEFLLLDAMSRTIRSEVAAFAFIVDAKDEAAAAFYARYGLRALGGGGRRLFLPVAEIAKLFA